MKLFLPTLELILLLFSVFFSTCTCQNNSSESSSSDDSPSVQADDKIFPSIVIGKDATSLYFANLSFGSPGQSQALRLDIAQPYTWILSGSENSECQLSGDTCDSSMSYLSNNSETAINLSNGHVYNFNFMDSIDINGSAVMDTMAFTTLDIPGEEDLFETYSINTSSTAILTANNLSITNVSFFDTLFSATFTKGSLGLGGKITGGTSEIDSAKFPNSFFFLQILTDLGVIESPSYSLWFGGDTVPYNLRKLPSGTMEDCGKLILGAVDPNLFIGELRKFKTIPFFDRETMTQSDTYPILPMGTIYIGSNTGKTLNVTSEQFIEPVLLDSRYSTTYLPIDAIVQIAMQIGATYVESLGKWLVPCSIASMGVQLDFSFDDITIKVPLEDFLVTTFDPESNTTMHFSNGDAACFLAIVSRSRTGYNILGGSFLKNIYMAVDLEDSSIAIAQAKRVTNSSKSSSVNTLSLASTNSSSSQVRAISSGNIPYASSRNSTTSIVLFPGNTPSATTNIPDQFTGTVDSDGLISTGRSFYETSRPNSSTKTSQTAYESFLLSSTGSSSNGANAKSNSGLPLTPTSTRNREKVLLFQISLLLGIVILGILL